MTRPVPLPDNNKVKDHPSSAGPSSTDATGASSASASAHNKRHRSTTTMTPEQLARKRANDRNAQRAIRARRKAQVSQLEAELEALKNKTHACCRKLLQRNLELECELAMMKGSPLPCPPRATPTHADQGTSTHASPEMHRVHGQLESSTYPHGGGEDSATTGALLLPPAGGCDSPVSGETTSPAAVMYPKCGLESTHAHACRDAPLQGPMAAVYAAEGINPMANPALDVVDVTCRQVLWPAGTPYAPNAGGIMDGLVALEVQNIMPAASAIPSPHFPQ